MAISNLFLGFALYYMFDIIVIGSSQAPNERNRGTQRAGKHWEK